jgi:hypothetical protein
MNDESHIELPADLVFVAHALEALALHDAAGAPGLEDRIAQASLSLLPGRGVRMVSDDPARLSGDGASSEVVTAGVLRFFTPLRLAAAVALSAGAIAVWMATLTGTSTTPERAHAGNADEAEFHLVLAALDHSWFGEGDLDLLRLEADVVADSLSWDWPLSSEGAL